MKHILELNQELLGIFSFLRDTVQGLGELALQRHTREKIEQLYSSIQYLYGVVGFQQAEKIQHFLYLQFSFNEIKHVLRLTFSDLPITSQFPAYLNDSYISAHDPISLYE